MKNTVACGNCRFYDQQYRYKAGRRVPVWLGYCAKQSTYPAQDPDPEAIPPIEVKRAGPGERVHLKIVARTDTLVACHLAEAK